MWFTRPDLEQLSPRTSYMVLEEKSILFYWVCNYFCSWKCWYRESILYEWTLAKTQTSENKISWEQHWWKRWIQKITCYKSGWRNLTERKLEQSKVWGNIILLKNIKLLLLIPQLGIKGGRSTELKELTYSINTHHLLLAPTKSQKMLF